MPSALDLRSSFPRSPFDELGGYPWLGRMIDKARAHAAGTGGGYTAYPCPGDRHFLAHFGLDADALGSLIRTGAADDEILAYVQEHARGGPEAVSELRRELLTPPAWGIRLAVWALRTSLARAIRQRSPGVDLHSLVTFAMVVAAEEGYPVPSSALA